MPVPLLPIALTALRAVGYTAGRAGLMAAREVVKNPRFRRTAADWAKRAAQQQAAGATARAVTPPAAIPTPSANAQAARHFYFQAAKHFGTPRPSGPQLMQFAQHQAQQQQNQGNEQAGASLTKLAVQATAAAGTVALLRLSLRSYNGNIVEVAESLQRLNPTIAVATAQFRRDELLRQFSRARGIEGSTAGLLAARSQLANAQQPFGIEMQNMKNLINTIGTSAQAATINFFNRIGVDDLMRKANQWLSKRLGIDLKAEQGDQLFKQWLRDTAQGKYSQSLTPAEMGERRPPVGGR